MSSSRRILSFTLVFAVALSSVPVFAQQLEEVIVTARKRQESIMKVPVVESVVGLKQLQQYSLTNLQDISDRVPGLVVGSATLSFGNQVSLRGIGTSTLNTTIDQSVSLNVDGMQMTQGLAYAAAMFDVKQVEVLKGPQALFYGKASPGGVISVTTANPGDKPEMTVRYGYEREAHENRTDLIISGPVTDTLGVRLATRYSNTQGYFKNKAQAYAPSGAEVPKKKNFAPETDKLLRATVVWTPTDRFRSQLKFNWMQTRRNGDGGGLQMTSCPDGISAPSGIPFLGGGENCKLDKTLRIVDMNPKAFPGIRNNGTPFSRVDQEFGTLELNYDIQPELTLTSVTGAYDLDQSSMINGPNTTYAAPPLAADPDFQRRDVTEELRLTSDYSGSPVNFMVGAFYQDGLMTYTNNVIGNVMLGFPPVLNKGVQHIDITTASLFGQILWDITPDLELAAGARWTDEKRKLTVYNKMTSMFTAGPRVRMQVPTPKLANKDVSPELTLTYTPTDQLTLFGSWKQAYKSGSYDTVTIPTPGQDTSFGDEKISGFEAGLKSLLFDRSFRFNVAGYYYKYDDLQVGANATSQSGQIIIRTLNAAKATIYGMDMSVDYAPPVIPRLRLYGGLNFNHAEYDKFDNATCWGGQTVAEGCNRLLDPSTGLYTAQDLTGDRLVRAPEWSANVGLDYDVDVGGGKTLELGWNTTYSSWYWTNLLVRSDMKQRAFFKHDASVTLRGENDGWELALIGKNLTDELVSGNCVNANVANGVALGGVITGGTTQGPAGVEELECNVERGRSVWLQITVHVFNLLGG